MYRPPVKRISMQQRPHVVRTVPGRTAAVAVPTVVHPELGECLVVTRRAVINGHTGERMSHAGDVVLFGGSVEPDEEPSDAALRELCEEAGTLDLLGNPDLVVRQYLGSWTTESGFFVEGYLVVVPEQFVDLARPDTREVNEIAYLPLDDVRTSPRTLEYHGVDALDHALDEHPQVEFQSPTIRVTHPTTGDTWTLWGLAGFMVSQWLTAESA